MTGGDRGSTQESEPGGGAGLVVRGATLGGHVVSLRAAGGVIEALGPPEDVEARRGDHVIEGAGMALAPGMVNAHTHAAMTLFRSYGDDLPLMTWLQTRIWPAEARLEPDDVYWGARLACLEMIRSGTVRFVDMYWHAPEVARAAADAGLHAMVGAALFDGGPAGGDADAPAALRYMAESSLDAMAGTGERITPFLGPHAVYTVSVKSLEWIGATAVERGVGVHIHLSETREEVERCVEATGLRPPALLDRCGLLGPSTILAHGCWLEPAELELVAERGATLVAVPASNLKLATGRTLPYEQARLAGAALGLGTDGVASNNSLDLFSDVKLLALMSKFASDDPSVLPAAEALAVARGQRSPILGGQELAVGAPADFLLLRTDVPEMVPGDLDANLAYGSSGSVVDTTVVAGQVLMADRQVAGSEEVIDQVRSRLPRLLGIGR